MGKKRDKANENIIHLIDDYVDLYMSSLGNNCPYWSDKIRPCENSKNDCEWCKDKYREDLRERKVKDYIVL